jgi:hypothetical protein
MKRKLNKYHIIALFTSIIFLLLLSYLFYKKEISKNDFERRLFNSKYGSFEVYVPKDWSSRNDSFIEATEEWEATPDAGMQINIDDESFIYVAISRIRIYHRGTKIGEIQTNDGKSITLYSDNNSDHISTVKFSDSMCVYVRVADKTYDKYETEILNLIKSVKAI